MLKPRYYDALVQWCLVFDRPLSKVIISETTVCTLHGALIRQQLNVFLREEQPKDSKKNQAFGNINEEFSVVYEGIPCTLGELQDGKIDARLRLEFATENIKNHPGKVLRNAAWKDIDRTELIPWLQSLQKHIIDGKREDGKIITLDGLVKKSGYIDDRSLKYKSALAAARGVSLQEISPAQAHQALVRELIDKKEYIRHGSSATLALYNGKGEIVGCKSLLVD